LAAEVLAAHCSCGTGLLFSPTVATYDLTSEYCGGSDGCQTSVLDLLVAMVADGEAARDGLGVKLASRCSYSGRRLSEASACYAATTTCGDAVTALAVAGDQGAFCDLDPADYACFDDCLDADMVVAPPHPTPSPLARAHGLFLSFSFDLVRASFCINHLAFSFSLQVNPFVSTVSAIVHVPPSHSIPFSTF
jgi:hypothetical protein